MVILNVTFVGFHKPCRCTINSSIAYNTISCFPPPKNRFIPPRISTHMWGARTAELVNIVVPPYTESACLKSNLDPYLKSVLCGLVVRVPGYRSRGPGFDQPREYNWGATSSGSGLENREYGSGDPLRWRRDTLYMKNLALTSQTSGGCSVGIVRLRTKATEFRKNEVGLI
jgi:hypothetical protein